MTAALASRAVSRGLERLPAIPLDELVSGAALLTRVDRKYLIPGDRVEVLLRGLDPGTRVLEIAGSRGFEYASVYFDTPERLSYLLAARPRRRRFKLRTRLYCATGAAYLEMKTQGGRGSTVKERIAYPVSSLRRLTPAGLDYAGAVLDATRIDSAVAQDLGPALETRYRRTTLLTSDGGRVTLDTGLRWIDVDGRELALGEHVVVESKSSGQAGALDRSLWRSGYRPVNLSKFGVGTAALHPELPSNRWARLLRGPLREAHQRKDPS